ncbi:Nuclear cap-binding protein subunit 1, partial [Kickxella alabastrina]
MDFSGRLGGRRGGGSGGGGGGRRDVDEFGRERRDRPHNRKPYERPGRGGGRGGGHGMGRGGMAGGHVGGHLDEAKDIESRLSSLIIKVGDKNTPTLQNNLDALSVVLEKDFTKHEITVLRTFRQCVLELPWKVTVYSTLAGLLNVKNRETGEKVVTLMHAVLRESLEKGRWGSVKVLMRFFALLVGTNTISAHTFLAMVQVLLGPVVDAASPVTASGNCYVFIVMSTLLWAGRSLKEHAPAELDQVLTIVGNYVGRHSQANEGVTITTVFHDAPPKGSNILAYLLDILRAVAANDWKIDAISAPHEMFAAEFAQAKQHELPLLELPSSLAPGAFYTPSEFLQLVPSPAEHAVR